MYWRVDDLDYSASRALDVADTIAAWIQGTYAPLISSGISFTGIEVRGLMLENDFVDTFSVGFPIAGGIASSNNPGNVVLSIKRAGLLTGRTQRGRVYVPVPRTKLLTDANLVDATWAGDIADAFAQMQNDVETAYDVTCVVISRWSNGVKRTDALPVTINSWDAVDTRVDSMRRRLTGRGS